MWARSVEGFVRSVAPVLTDVLEIEQAGVVRRWRAVDIGVTARQGKARLATFMT